MESLITKPKILIVDDEPPVLDILTKSMSPDYEVTTATSKMEVSGKLGVTSYDFILLDQHLEDGLGSDFEKFLTDMKVPHAYITGMCTVSILDKLNVKIFKKPFSIAEINIYIKEQLGTK